MVILLEPHKPMQMEFFTENRSGKILYGVSICHIFWVNSLPEFNHLILFLFDKHFYLISC